jgi:phosphoglucosamine mutase
MEIEGRISGAIGTNLARPDKLGRAKRLDDAAGRYIEFVKHTFPKRSSLAGIKVVLDCANGAAYKLGPTILWELGAEVIAIGVNPNGFNINDNCGSTSPEAMCAEVVKQGADIGIALDGDADRLIICDEKGKIIDGDKLLAVIALHQKKLGTLQGGGIVATSMSNMALDKYLESVDLHVKRTAVGDRYVSKFMRENGYNVGGEQSGHIILRDYVTTGDGLVAALQVLAVLVGEGKPVSKVCDVFAPFPQVLKNVRFKGENPVDLPDVQAAIVKAEKELAGQGRVLIRKSGTEPLLRIMIEGRSQNQIELLAGDIASIVEKKAGAR